MNQHAHKEKTRAIPNYNERSGNTIWNKSTRKFFDRQLGKYFVVVQKRGPFLSYLVKAHMQDLLAVHPWLLATNERLRLSNSPHGFEQHRSEPTNLQFFTQDHQNTKPDTYPVFKDLSEGRYSERCYLLQYYNWSERTTELSPEIDKIH